jgi:hypothetical protein
MRKELKDQCVAVREDMHREALLASTNGEFLCSGESGDWRLAKERKNDAPLRRGDLDVERIDGASVVHRFAFGVDERRSTRADGVAQPKENGAEHRSTLIANRDGPTERAHC